MNQQRMRQEQNEGGLQCGSRGITLRSHATTSMVAAQSCSLYFSILLGLMKTFSSVLDSPITEPPNALRQMYNSVKHAELRNIYLS